MLSALTARTSGQTEAFFHNVKYIGRLREKRLRRFFNLYAYNNISDKNRLRILHTWEQIATDHKKIESVKYEIDLDKMEKAGVKIKLEFNELAKNY